MLTNTGCTIYNQYKNVAAGRVEYYRTYLPAVHWEPSKGANVLKSGIASADGLKLYIPFSVDTGGKQHVDSKAFAAASPAALAGLWTLDEGKGYVTKGNTPEARTEVELTALLRANAEAYLITTVDARDFGNPRMRHWEVGGK